MKKTKPFIFVCLLFLLSIGFIACAEAVNFHIEFIVDGEVYHTVDIGRYESLTYPQVPSKTGYEFAGWYLNDSWQSPFSDDALIYINFSVEVTVYAKWRTGDIGASFEGFSEAGANTYSLTIPNAVTTLDFSTIVTINERSSWKLTYDSQGNNEITNKAVLPSAGNNIYYVHVTAENRDIAVYTLQVYRKPLYTIMFNTQGGSTVTAQTVEEGGLAAFPAPPVKTGYTFVGWNYDFDEPMTSSLIVSAIWQARTYKINYHADNGGTDILEQNAVFNSSVTLYGGDVFSNVAHMISKWNTSADGSGKDYALNFKIADYNTARNLDLYAVWTAAPYEDGRGTSAEPFMIVSKAQFILFRDLVNKGNHYSDVYFALNTDIDLGGEEWLAIGKTYSNRFEGHFDGRGHIVKNFQISAEDMDGGLFGVVNEGTISNLGVKNFEINISSAWASAGGLVGWLIGGSVTNCYATGSASAEYAGGLIGFNSNGLITGCYATGAVSGEYAGGLTGLNNGTIMFCYASGNVNAEVAVSGEISGGLVGYNRGSVIGCYATGNISGYSAGGLIGLSDEGVISNCYASGVVFGYDAGGLVGYNSSSTVTGCYATGEVSGDYAGGLIGNNQNARIEYCYATGDVVLSGIAGGLIGNNGMGKIDNCYAAGNVYATDLAGGLIGANLSITDSRGKIIAQAIVTSCYATGNITVESSTLNLGNLHAAALFGRNDKESIVTNSFYYIDAEIVRRVINEESTNQPSNSVGSSCTLEQLNSETFYTETLGWDAEIWDFSDLDLEAGKTPVLRVD